MRYLTLFLLLPSAALAAGPTDFKSLVALLLDIISTIVPFIFTLALLVIVWGMIEAWIIGGGDERKVEAGKQKALTSVIVLVIMLGIWGILAFLRQGLFGV